MKVELDTIQLVGIWLMLSGIFLHSVIFLVAYIKIATQLIPDDNDNKKNEEEEEKKGFPIVRFIIKVRKVLKVVMNEEKREEYKCILTIVDWTIISTFGMVILGVLMIVLGTVF